MVEELKLAIKVDDDAIEQSLLKQFANAEKMANKVVLTFNNIDLDDKAIEAKFKEMQKIAGKNPIDLSIDKSSIEMLSAISKQLGNIFDIAKGKSIIDSSATVSEINKITQATKELNKAQTGSENIQSKSFTTKNKTEAYNQLKQMADVFKNFYGNEEAMHTKAGTEAAYAYYKAYEEALKKGVAQSRLESVTVDVDKDGFFVADRIVSSRIQEFENFKKYGGEATNLSVEISILEERLSKFSDAYSKVKTVLGKAPITPEIIQNIEEYVRNLEIAEARTKDADLMGFTKEDIDLYKDSANMYLGFATEDAIRENEKYISSLKEVKEEKENVDASLSKSQISDMDSSLVEQQNKIQEELKETQKQAEQTSESLSKIGDINKPNVSSGIQIEDVFQGDDKATTDASTTAIKEESQALEQVSTSAKDAATSKEKFANANKEVKASADNSKTSISEEEKYFNSLGKSLTQYRNTLTSISRKPADGNRSQELQEKIDIISSSLKKLNALKSKTEENGYIFNKNDVDTGKQLEKTIKENIELVKQMSVAQKGSDALSRGKEIDTITKYLNKFTGISKEAKHELNGLLDKLQSGDPSVNVKKIHERFLELTVAERNAGREARNLFDIFKDKKIYSFLGQAASMFSFYDLINYGREGISTLKEFDDGLTKISYTMDMTKSKLNDLGKSVLEMANDLDSSIDNAMQVSQIYANMNTSAEEIKKLSEPTLILSNLTGFDASTVADDIQAVTQQFEIAAEDSMHIADVYDYISRNIAVDYSKFWSLYWKQYNENKSKSVKTKLFYN